MPKEEELKCTHLNPLGGCGWCTGLISRGVSPQDLGFPKKCSHNNNPLTCGLCVAEKVLGCQPKPVSSPKSTSFRQYGYGYDD